MKPATAAKSAASRWQPELWLVIGLPLIAVIASLITLALATHNAWSPTDTRVDRFGRPVQQEQVQP